MKTKPLLAPPAGGAFFCDQDSEPLVIRPAPLRPACAGASQRLVMNQRYDVFRFGLIAAAIALFVVAGTEDKLFSDQSWAFRWKEIIRSALRRRRDHLCWLVRILEATKQRYPTPTNSEGDCLNRNFATSSFRRRHACGSARRGLGS